RSGAARHPDSTEGHQGRLASLRPALLPPLPPRRASCAAGRYVHVPRGVSVRHAESFRSFITEGVVMSSWLPNGDARNARERRPERRLNRRAALLCALAGATALTSTALGGPASAQGAMGTGPIAWP